VTLNHRFVMGNLVKLKKKRKALLLQLVGFLILRILFRSFEVSIKVLVNTHQLVYIHTKKNNHNDVKLVTFKEEEFDITSLWVDRFINEHENVDMNKSAIGEENVGNDRLLARKQNYNQSQAYCEISMDSSIIMYSYSVIFQSFMELKSMQEMKNSILSRPKQSESNIRLIII
jgi:hypothetical protein